MDLLIRAYAPADAGACAAIWNAVIAEGRAFSREEPLDPAEAEALFAAQRRTGVAEEAGEPTGVYLLRDAAEGRSAGIARVSWAVRADRRGSRLDEQLLLDAMGSAKRLGYRLLLPDPVISGNAPAIKLYNKLGFTRMGTLPGAFRLPEGGTDGLNFYYIRL